VNPNPSSTPVRYGDGPAEQIVACLTHVVALIDGLVQHRAGMAASLLDTWQGAHKDRFQADFTVQQAKLGELVSPLRTLIGRVNEATAEADGEYRRRAMTAPGGSL
jgi:hypothetical protein